MRSSPSQRRVVDGAGARKADLAAIHIAKAALQWDEGTYRDVMQAVVRHRSSAELDFAARKRFLEHLHACMAQKGLQMPVSAPKRGKKAWGPKEKLLWSLWQRLADVGKITDRSLKGLNAWIKRQTGGATGVDSIDFLNPQQLDGVIDNAKLWVGR